MSTLLHKTVKTSGWRFRRVNGESVYSVDHNDDSLREIASCEEPKVDQIVNLLTKDFCNRVRTVVSPVSQWIDENTASASYLRVFKVTCDKLKNEPDKNSVRQAKIPPGSKLKIFGKRDRFADPTFNVLVLEQRLTDLRTSRNFSEFTIFGVLPWFRTADIETKNGEMFVPIESVILNCDVSGMSRESLRLLNDCRLPKYLIVPFGKDGAFCYDENDDGSRPTAEQLVSFCIRWHVARKSKTNSFFEHVVDSSQKTATKELDAQMYSRTVKYFKERCAAEALFSNASFFATVVELWNKNLMSINNRVWMQRQFVDALEFLVDAQVLQLGRAARLLFANDVVVSTLSYFMPQVVVGVPPVQNDFFVIDFFSLHNVSLKVDICDLARKFDAELFEIERPFKIESGKLLVPLSTACRFVCCIVRAAMIRLLNETEFKSDAQHNEEWLIDSTVMPLRNTDVYAKQRTTRYDDFPVDGKVSKPINLSVQSTSFSTEAITACNLPELFGLVDNNVDLDGSHVDPNSSIPLKSSAAMIRVSQNSLNDACSASLPDIEDLGNSLQQNPCINLHNNNTLPLCARKRTSVLVNTSDKYLMFDDRWFVHKFFMSLDLPHVTHDAIVEFMLKNSTDESLKKKHRVEIDAFPKRHDKYLQKKASREQQGDFATPSASSYLGKCHSEYTKKHCPLANLTSGFADAENEFKQLLKDMQHPLALKNDAIQRIIDATKRTKSITTGCMQEYIETRSIVNEHVEAKPHPDLTFERPKHYVLACADHLNRSM